VFFCCGTRREVWVDPHPMDRRAALIVQRDRVPPYRLAKTHHPTSTAHPYPLVVVPARLVTSSAPYSNYILESANMDTLKDMLNNWTLLNNKTIPLLSRCGGKIHCVIHLRFFADIRFIDCTCFWGNSLCMVLQIGRIVYLKEPWRVWQTHSTEISTNVVNWF